MTQSTPRPGDAVIAIDGQAFPLRLTLGALADIEDKVGEGSLEILRDRLTNPRIADLLIILHALLFGGGAAMTLSKLKTSDIDLEEASAAIAKAFQAFGGAEKKPNRAVTKKSRKGSRSVTGSVRASSS